MQRVQVAEIRIVDRTAGINLLEFLCQTFDGPGIGGFLAQDALGDQIADVRRRQQKTDRITILDFPKQIVLDFPGVFDLLLQGSQYPQWVFLSPFSKELQEPKILIEALN